MPTLRFHLQTAKKDKNGFAPINLAYRNRGECFMYTGLKVKPADWSQNAINSWIKPSHGSGQVGFNLALKSIIGIGENIMNSYFVEHHRFPDTKTFKKTYTARKAKPKNDFFDFFERFVTYQTNKENNVCKGTSVNYDKCLKRLQSFEKHTGKELTFESINVEFAANFPAYCRKEFGNSGNTVGTYIRVLKTFLNWAELHHKIKLDKLAMSEMQIRDEENFHVYLQKEELDILRAMDLSTSPLLEVVRDAFVLQCCLGCRYGDLKRMLTENIVQMNGNFFVQMKTKKNKKLVTIPVSSRITSILEKYKDIAPTRWVPTLDQTNKHIKTICKLAKFFDKIVKEVDKGVSKEVATFFKYELVSTHTARRTFINTMKADGVQDSVIALMTGQTIRTIQRYKQSDTADVEKAMLKWDGKAEASPEPRERN